MLPVRVKSSTFPKPESKASEACRRLIVQLSKETALGLERQARKEGMSVTKLVAALINVIEQDDLYAAAIDRATPESHSSMQAALREQR